MNTCGHDDDVEMQGGESGQNPMVNDRSVSSNPVTSTDNNNGNMTGIGLIQRHFLRSNDSTRPDVDMDDLYNITKPSNRYIRLLQYFCFMIAVIALLYFIIALQHYEVATQYMQIAFITSLTIALDSTTPCRQFQWLIIASSIAILWVTLWVYTKSNIANNAYNLAIAGISGYLFFIGLLRMTYKAFDAPADVKFVELDLLLYLLSLNAICWFSSNEFNNNLHMILDIRTIMLLFNCLYQPKQKMELLRIPSFILVIILILLSFIVYAMGNLSDNIIGNCFYIVIGLILIFESFHAKPIPTITKESLSMLSLSFAQQSPSPSQHQESLKLS